MIKKVILSYGLNDLGFESRQAQKIYLFTKTLRLVLGPTQPPIQWVPGTFPPEVKRKMCEADHSPSFNADVKNEWSYTSTPPCLHSA
jgi:hypothetical protein